MAQLAGDFPHAPAHGQVEGIGRQPRAGQCPGQGALELAAVVQPFDGLLLSLIHI